MKLTRLVALALAAISPAVVLIAPALAAPQPITTLTAPAPAPLAPPPVAPAPAPVSPAPAPPAPAPPTPVRATAATTPAPAPPAATKPPSFELVDRGDAVEIIARNVKAARTAIFPIRSRLEVPLVGTPAVKRVVPADATVKVIELDGDQATRSLSVKLGFERADVKALSRFAQAIQVGDDLHLLIPRRLPVEGVAAKLPEPTLTPELAAAVARIEPPAAPQIGPKPAPDAAGKAEIRPAAAIEPATAATIDAKPDIKPETKNDATPEANLDVTLGAVPHPITDARPVVSVAKPTAASKPLKQSLAADGDDTWSRIAMYAAIGLAAAGAGIWLLRRRRAHLVPPASIEIIAQRSLGNKARIVWLSVGPREMIVSVTAQQVRMLGQWRKTDVAASLPAAHTYSDARLDARHESGNDSSHESVSESIYESGAGAARGSAALPLPTGKPVSPAVSGILRLRGRTGQIPIAIADEVATGDIVADEIWVSEILAATGARR